MKCPECGRIFEPRSVVQKYCSIECGIKYRKAHGTQNPPSISFRCAWCGHMVVTDGLRDKRTRFCCQQCEKKFWRHPPQDSESSRINFRSLEEYGSWERRTNE